MQCNVCLKHRTSVPRKRDVQISPLCCCCVTTKKNGTRWSEYKEKEGRFSHLSSFRNAWKRNSSFTKMVCAAALVYSGHSVADSMHQHICAFLIDVLHESRKNVFSHRVPKNVVSKCCTVLLFEIASCSEPCFTYCLHTFPHSLQNTQSETLFVAAAAVLDVDGSSKVTVKYVPKCPPLLLIHFLLSNWWPIHMANSKTYWFPLQS